MMPSRYVVEVRVRGVVGLLVAGVLLAGCAESEEQGGDPSAREACRHFRNVAADADVLTRDELREKIAEVESDASVSEVSGVSSNARAMLSAITQGHGGRFDEAVSGFGDACREIGF